MACEPPTSRDDIEIGIVCALPLELDAAVAALDEVWDDDVRAALGRAPGDRNTYVLGRIGRHNVVLTPLRQRAGKPTMGKGNAALVASDLRHSYPGLCLALLVGICGGTREAAGREMLLGDVVISDSIVQYDFGRRYDHEFVRKTGPQNDLAAPLEANASVLSHLASESGKERLRERTVAFLKEVQQRRPNKYALPDPATDRLFESHYRHKHQTPRDCECLKYEKDSDPVCDKAMESTCHELGCDDSYLVKRARLEERVAAAAAGADFDADVFMPAIHVGKVATGDTVMKSAGERDAIAAREKIIAFEMEAAGIWEQLPCLVVKSVCDYADSHKNKDWQDYAAATAAAAAKGIVMLHTPADRAKRVETKPFRREYMVPFTPDPDFVSRPAISAWLGDMSRKGGERVALVGLGGIGKSQLAIQFAHGVRNKSHVFWLDITTWATLEASCRAVAERLGLSTPGQKSDSDSVTAQEMLRRVGDWLGREENGRWTVILDNFDDASMLPADDPHLMQLLPQVGHGFVLVTSRTTAAAQKLTGDSPANVYAVPPMGEDEALDLLRAKIYKKEALVEEDGREVVQLLGCMPLAVSQTAAYLNRPGARVSVKGYADMLRDPDKLGRLLGAEYQELRRSGAAGSNAVLTTWMVTFNQMQREQPAAADLLSLMSFFSPQSIPEWVLRAGYDFDVAKLPPTKVKDTMSSSMVGFVSLMPSFKSRRYLYRNLDDEANLRVWTEWMEADGGPPAKGGDEQEAADQAKVAEKAPEGRRKSGLSFKAKKWFSSSKSEGSSKSGSSSKGSTVLEPLLGGLQASGKEDDGDADERLGRDLETLLGYSLVSPSTFDGILKMHPLVRYCTQTWLARTGRLAKWKKRFMLVMSAALDFEKQPDLWTPQGNLVIHLEPMVPEEPRPGDGPGALLWLRIAKNVFYSRRAQGSKEAAATLLDRMIAVADETLGQGHRLTLSCLNIRCQALVDEREYDKAAALCQEILERAVWVDDYVNNVVFKSRVQYADILRAQGDFAGAEVVVSEMVAQRAHSYGEHHDDTLESMAKHMAAMVDVKKYQEAGDAAVKLLSEDWAAKDQDTFRRVITYVAMSVVHAAGYAEGDEVGNLVRRVVEAVEGAPDTCRWFPNMACGPFHLALFVWLTRQGRDAEGIAALDRGIEHMANVFALPKLHPPGLAESLLAAREDDEDTRQRMLREVIANFETDDGTSRQVFYWQMANIGRRLYMQGRDDEGAVLLDALDRHMKASLGEQHFLVRTTAGLDESLRDWRAKHPRKEQVADKGEPGPAELES